MQKRGQAPFRRGFRIKARIDFLDQKRMLGHGIGKLAFSLSVPARNEGQTVGDILDLDIHRCWIQQIQPPPRQHPLPRTFRHIGLLKRQT